MPQRGEHKLHLYDLKKAPRTIQLEPLDPDYSFKGHRTLARDFLWRTRGSVDDGVENRDFQLITWGADNELILHRMREKHLKLVGYEKGAATSNSGTSPSRGSDYISFRDPPQMTTPPATMSSQIDLTNRMRTQPLPDAFGGYNSPGMKRAPIPMTRNQANGALTMTYSNTQSKIIKRTDNDLIAWMKGVKFGKRTLSGKRKRNKSLATDATDLYHQTETLSEEIIHVGEKFTKIAFEEIDVAGRRVVVSFNGPWSAGKHMVFLRLGIKFPLDYPDKACPIFQFERFSTVPEERLDSLESNVAKIATSYLPHQTGSLQAVLFYLLGEYTLEQSIHWLAEDEVLEHGVTEAKDDGSSSDEEDNLGEFVNAQAQALEEEHDPSANAIGGGNALVPLSNTCGATFSADGRLVCFFLPRKEPPSMLNKLMSEYPDKQHTLFEGFGKLRSRAQTHSTHHNKPVATEHGRQIQQDTGSDSSSGMTTDSSSESDEDVDAIARKFNTPKAWQGARLPMGKFGRHTRYMESDQRPLDAENGFSNVGGVPKISIYKIEDLLPHRHSLAREYQIDGSGPTACSHNALIAEDNGLAVTANIWRLLELVLATIVPLALVEAPGASAQMFVMASTDLPGGRKRSRHTQPDTSVKPFRDGQIRGNVKWGSHPFGRGWLIRTILDYLDKRADVQSLAMLACVLAKPATIVVNDASSGPKEANEAAWPTPFIEYHTTRDIGVQGQQVAVPSSTGVTNNTTRPTRTTSARLNTPMTPKMPHSYKARRSELLPAETHKVNTLQSTSLSEHMPLLSHGSEGMTPRYDASSLAAPGWARSLNLSLSPPVTSMARLSPSKMSFDDHVATSVPTVASSIASAVGTTRRFKPSASSAAPVPRSFSTREVTPTQGADSGSDTECDEPSTPPNEPVKVTFTNKSHFDDEGCARVSLLDPEEEVRHRATRTAYARILDAWGMLIEKQEVLQYNGVAMRCDAVEDGRRIETHSSQRTVFATSDHATADRDGLALTRCCISCGYAGQASTWKGEGKCVQCASPMRILNCSICLEPVDALLKSCLSCGHVAHLRCLSLLAAGTTDEERASRKLNGFLECEAGCGCECSDLEAWYGRMR